MSLQKLVTRSFTVPDQAQAQHPAMEWEDLLGYLRNIDDFNKPPLEAILAQTDVVGDPSMPKAAECAVLRWVERSFQEWEQSFPLEWELTYKLRTLKPALAISSLSEESFFRPGQHPLHQMLDAVHDAAIGWQGDLGRAGEAITRLVDGAIQSTREYVENGGDIDAIARQVTTEEARMRSRSEKMTQRTVAVEQGKLRAAQAKSTAAAMINDQLQRYSAPPEINTLITGAWYESAQLTYLKFGDTSREWRDFSDTTGQLLEALQPLAELSDSEREVRMGLAKILPAELQRQLLSIQHESDLLQQAVASYEYLLQRVAGGQTLVLTHLLPIPIEGDSTGAPTTAPDMHVGQWFEVIKDSDVVRLKLVMIEAGQVLLCNASGTKGMSLTLKEFGHKLRTEEAQPLNTGASFSRALATAAGVDSDETLDQLSGGPAPAKTRESTSSEDGIPQLPIGTWLGFHDSDTPLMAKLALHDKVRKELIFVNRKGVELRRLDEASYLALIEAGQVDILETRSNFREQVERAREQIQQDEG